MLPFNIFFNNIFKEIPWQNTINIIFRKECFNCQFARYATALIQLLFRVEIAIST
ncbi:hypothetical protein B4064_3011 [Caldibacillus thermoamylovorans]|nr:hypothetical protein B4064_3011 [Caldibacillus thermoamylovorans]